MSICLDRFGNDPVGAAIAAMENAGRESGQTCEWCARPAMPGEGACRECKDQDKIYNMPSDKFLEYLQYEADDFEQTMLFDGKHLCLCWRFNSPYAARKVTKILKARRLKYLATEYTVTFWVGWINKCPDFLEAGK